MTSYTLLALGLVLLVGVGILIWRRPSESSPMTVMFIAGVGLILFSDDRILNFKFGASGVEVTRKDLQQAQVDYAAQIAALARDVEEQKRALAQLKRPDGTYVSAPDTAADPSKQAADQVFAENSKYSILVFYRDDAEQTSTNVVASLLKAGFKSAKVNTDLSEIGRALPKGSIRVRFNEGFDQVAARVFDIIKTNGNAALDPRAAARPIPGDVQILLY